MWGIATQPGIFGGSPLWLRSILLSNWLYHSSLHNSAVTTVCPLRNFRKNKSKIVERLVSFKGWKAGALAWNRFFATDIINSMCRVSSMLCADTTLRRKVTYMWWGQAWLRKCGMEDTFVDVSRVSFNESTITKSKRNSNAIRMATSLIIIQLKTERCQLKWLISTLIICYKERTNVS